MEKKEAIEVLKETGEYLNRHIGTESYNQRCRIHDAYHALKRLTTTKEPRVSAEEFLTMKGLWNYAGKIKIGRDDLKKMLEEYASTTQVERVSEEEEIYFIEDSKTQMWHYVRNEYKEGDTVHSVEMVFYPEWTNDPHKAKKFSTKEDAEREMKEGMFIELRGKGFIVTDHQFTNPTEGWLSSKQGADAIAFAEWLRTFEGLTRENGYWVLDSQISSEELYDVYLKDHPLPPPPKEEKKKEEKGGNDLFIKGSSVAT